MRKIKLSHTEADVKVLLEVLGVYCILVLMLVGVYYLEPAITGFAAVTKQFNYTDEVNLEFSESGEYVWNLANPGNLKSIKIEGSKTEGGEAKAYIEDNGIKYLIFDSSRLAEKPSGMFGITGFVAAEDNDKGEGKEPNHPPGWNSSIDSFTVNESLTINLNNYFNDKDNDILAYSASELKADGLEILLENEMLTVNNKNNIEADITLEITASDNETSKKKNIVLILIKKELINKVPINETPLINETITNETTMNETQIINETLVNETIINETIEKIININLDYGNNEVYDANNDGIESLIGIIDFSVGNSEFNWDVNEEKLCTRYEIYSADNEESTFVCFGNSDCCALVGLGSSRDLWNDELFLGYGSYGSTANNIVFAQVLYADYSLDIENPYSEVVYSLWDNKTAKFVEGIIQFEDACIDTCMFSGNESSYKLVIEIENTTLRIDKIEYLIEKRAINADPVLLKQIENLSVLENTEYILDLSEYFSDDDNDELIYSYYETGNMTIRFADNQAYIMPDRGFAGSRFTFITANDSYGQAVSNVFKIEVKSKKLSIELADSKIEEKNWSVRFNTAGTGNLTISAVGSYAELHNDDAATINDLDILKLKCGDFEIFDKNELIETENVWFVLMNDSRARLADLVGESLPIKSVYVESYNCDDETGYFTAGLLKEGANSQEFKFGDEIRTAGIIYIEGIRETFEVRDKEGNKLAVFDSSGNVNIKGVLMQNASIEADENDFAVKNETNGLNLVIKNPEGNLLIKGYLSENENLLQPTPNSLIIQNKNGRVIAYVNSTGSLFLTGALTERALFG